MNSNLTSPGARRRAGNPMQTHDALPAPLRRWLIHAALPWSARSALRLWQGALSETGCEAAAITRLNRAEMSVLRREASVVWGDFYPV